MKYFSVLAPTLLFQILFFWSCKKDTAAAPVQPRITVSTSVFQVVEDASPASVNVPVLLSAASNKVVTVDYSTTDSTAIAGMDYVAVTSGHVTFQPGETSKVITINIMQDTAQKQDVYFSVNFINPVNADLPNSRIRLKIINVDYASLVWSDEFTDASLNTANWNYETGKTGWGNNELENYTNSVANVHLDSGYLHISALNPSGTDYTSGRITTQGKKEFTYGKFVIRAKLPEGQGIWPALWMLGGNISAVGWPQCGEIDMMELLGQTPNKVYGTVHWNENGHKSSGGSMSLPSGTFSNSFHNFVFIWTPNHFKWIIDNQQYFALDRSGIPNFPWDLPEFFIFNVAVGGNWPGNPDNTTVFPQHMIVDYIRVYQ